MDPNSHSEMTKPAFQSFQHGLGSSIYKLIEGMKNNDEKEGKRKRGEGTTMQT